MPKWTKEQEEAIYEEGQNIIVSAGAGSGKTAVLTERVIEKLRKGVKINELLILTFTNAAALEMKDRIRRKIEEDSSLKENLEYLDSAYITTFDSYALSLVKKYHYLLNIDNDIDIVDESIISLVKEDILNNTFLEFYSASDSDFEEFIKTFAIKNDTNLQNSILKIIKKLELNSNIDDYLDHYLERYLNDAKIDGYIKEYEELLHSLLNDIETNLMYIESSSYPDYYEKLVNTISPLINSKSYDDILKHINVSLPKRPQNSEDIAIYRDNISDSIKNLKTYLRFQNTLEIKESLLISKKYIKVIIAIIKKYLIKLKEYKDTYNVYEFTDIAIMAINLLKENDSVKEELKNSYQEILLDEYQDTNLLQEEFISLISKNNVYMVGDIKQSIYGFRNASPSIFKNKYDAYSKNIGGKKIDLLKNFRSREEVLKGINLIFSLVMDDVFGGADYIHDHQMNFGNALYEEEKCNQNYNLEILNYTNEDKEFTNHEIEAFIIGNDIKNKIKNKYQVIDGNTKKLRDVRYDDFCIIMDRGTNFASYKKIFEYLEIPLSIYEDKKLTTEEDILLLNNLVGLVLKIKGNKLDREFKYYFVSIARSYLFNYTDNAILDIIYNNSFSKTDIYEHGLNIASRLDELSNYEVLELILQEFNFYEKLILVGNIESSIIRINNLLDIANNLNKLGFTLEMFKDYISKMISSKNEIRYHSNFTTIQSVKLMNIHKSKGLEFPICYFSGYYKKFNESDIKEKFTFDNSYGLITPFFKDGLGSTILMDLLKNKYYINNISEEIRLFYVSLTRAKEKIIIVTSLDADNALDILNYNIKRKYNSFLSMLNSICHKLTPYITNISLDSLNITKNYLYSKEKDNLVSTEESNKVTYKNIIVPNMEITNEHASKVINNIMAESDVKLLQKGSEMHAYFEQTDFLNIASDNPYYKQIKAFVSKMQITKQTKIYKEHEFLFQYEDVMYHGIIDLILIEEDIIKIVDYKLKNIDDPKYIKQLEVYYNYLKQTFNKEIKVYLYSMLDDIIKEIPMS